MQQKAQEAIARGALPEEWTRQELRQVIGHGSSKTAEVVRAWLRDGTVEKVEGSYPERLRFVMSSPAPVVEENIGVENSTDSQTVPCAHTHNPRISLLDAQIYIRGAVVILLALIVVIQAFASIRPRPETTEMAQVIPTPSLPSVTPTPTQEPRRIPVYFSPNGDYAGDVSIVGLADRVQARYGEAWAQADDGLWFRIGDLAGIQVGTLANLRPPEPTPTARVQVVVEQRPVYVSVPPTAVPPAAQSVEMVSRGIESGDFNLVCDSQGCRCVTTPAEDDVVVLALVSWEVCERER